MGTVRPPNGLRSITPENPIEIQPSVSRWTKRSKGFQDEYVWTPAPPISMLSCVLLARLISLRSILSTRSLTEIPFNIAIWGAGFGALLESFDFIVHLQCLPGGRHIHIITLCSEFGKVNGFHRTTPLQTFPNASTGNTLVTHCRF